MPEFFTPHNSTRTYEVDIKENNLGEIVFYVGGFPILYLNPATKKVHLVPNDIKEEVGLKFNRNGYVSVEYDADR